MPVLFVDPHRQAVLHFDENLSCTGFFGEVDDLIEDLVVGRIDFCGLVGSYC